MKMNTVYRKYLMLILGMSLMASCTDEFEEINQDPNNPTVIPTSYLLSSAERSLIKEFFGLNDEWGHNQFALRYIQHWTSTLYTSTDRYEFVEEDFSGVYNGGLSDLQEYLRLNTDDATAVQAAMSGSNANQIAVGRILRAWAYHNLTDIWGDIPYSQALLGAENPSPQYDSQEEIYRDLIRELSEATAQIDPSGTVAGDIIYDGDMESWLRFANSLRLRLGLRMSEVAPEQAREIVVSALEGGVLQSNEDNATFEYLASAPNNNPWNQDFYFGTVTLTITNTLVERLQTLNDPRLEVYAQPSVDENAYIGMPYGVNAGVAGSITNNQVSMPGVRLVEPTAPAILMTYSEVLFAQAEAAARGWIGQDAADRYEAAIRASLEYWGVAEVAIQAYLAQPTVAFNLANYRQLIGEQKWLSLYMQGMESWSEWRRLDYPALAPAPDAVENRGIPRRRGYPVPETTLNRANYEAAVSRQGPDRLDTRVWWDQ